MRTARSIRLVEARLITLLSKLPSPEIATQSDNNVSPPRRSSELFEESKVGSLKGKQPLAVVERLFEVEEKPFLFFFLP